MALSTPLASFVIFLQISSFSAASIPASDFEYHFTLEDGFALSWNYTNDSIIFQYQAKSQGWAGLGFSPSGSMEGADIAVFWVDGDGKGHVSDRHGPSKGNGWPPEDKHQDYILLDSYKDASGLTMTFTRKINTCDQEDMILVPDTMRVIYAMNDKVPVDSNNFEKHTYKSIKSMHFFDDRIRSPDGVPPEPGAVSFEFRVENKLVPDNMDTLYWCQIHPLPKVPEKRHIIKFEPVIQLENMQVVHHMLVYICKNNVSQFVGKAGPCFDNPTPLGDAFNGCQTQVLSAWAKGGQSVTYADDIGIPIYNPNEDQYVMMEMHYDNSQFLKGKIDSSGMRYWMTNKLRKIEAGQSTFGFGVNQYEQVIPPKQQEFINYAYCSADCTNNWPKEGLNFMGGVLHTHLAGRKVRFLHFRNGTQLPDILVDNYYDFNYQDYRSKSKPALVLPGDELVLECVYETLNRANTTFSGFSTHEEMCLVFLDYFPAVFDGLVCYSSMDWATKERILNLTSYGADVDWTPEKIQALKDAERDALHVLSCNKKPGTQQNPWDFLITSQYGYPNVTQPIVPPADPCKADASTSGITGTTETSGGTGASEGTGGTPATGGTGGTGGTGATGTTPKAAAMNTKVSSAVLIALISAMLLIV